MRLSYCVILLISAIACSYMHVAAQNESGILTADTHISSSPLSQDDQWHNLKRWVSLTFDNSNVIDMEDREKGTMIIKWSCPVKLSSDYVSAMISATYVIDVRDGKFRISRINPRVNFQLIRPDIIDDYVSARSEAASGDIKLISQLATKFYDGSFEWALDSQYIDITNAYMDVLSDTPQYRNDRDRERGKINDDWHRANRNWQLIRTPLQTFIQLDASMSKTLDVALKQNDDF